MVRELVNVYKADLFEKDKVRLGQGRNYSCTCHSTLQFVIFVI